MKAGDKSAQRRWSLFLPDAEHARIMQNIQPSRGLIGA
jgi:hypothetical protein